MYQSKFKEMRHSTPLYFEINGEIYGYVGATLGNEILEYFVKGEDYSLLLNNGSFSIRDFKTNEEIASGDDLMFIGNDDSILINHCFNVFNLIEMTIGEDLLDGNISFRLVCEDEKFRDLVLNDWEKWRDSQ